MAKYKKKPVKKAETKTRSDALRGQISDSSENLQNSIDNALAAFESNMRRKPQATEKLQIIMECRKAEFLRHFIKFDGNIALACIISGVARRTYHEWKQSDPDFMDAVTEINEAQIDAAERALLQNVKDGKETSIFFYLCNKGRGRGWQSINKIQTAVINAPKIEVEYAETPQRKDKSSTKELPVFTVDAEEA